MIQRDYKNTQSELQRLDQAYTFRNREKVLELIDGNAFLVPLLAEAYSAITKCFPHVQLFLSTFSDPEGLDEERLVIFIASNFTPEETLKKLDQLDDDWWLEALDRTYGKLSINVEFQ